MKITSSLSTLAELRAHTRDEHLRLESSDFVLPSTRTRERYTRLIAAMLAFHRALEVHFHEHEPALEGYGLRMAHRYRVPTLEREAAQLHAEPVASPALSYATAAHVAGAVYVMEGSTLGGTIIARSVRDSLALHSGYYGEFADTTAARWRETVTELERCGADAARSNAMREGARHTFGALYAHLALALA